MALYAFLRQHPRPTAQQLEDAMDGNLCRCTGYRPILDAVKSFGCDTERVPAASGGCCGGRAAGDGCCMTTRASTEGSIIDVVGVADASARPVSLLEDTDPLGRPLFRVTTTTRDKISSFGETVWSPDSEPIFPPYLKTHPLPTSLHLAGKRVTWYAPVSLDELLALKALHPSAKLVGGNTEVGIETRFKDCVYPVLLSTAHVPELLVSAALEPSVAPEATAQLEDALMLRRHGHTGADDVLRGVVNREEVLASCSRSGGLVIGGGVTLARVRELCELILTDSLHGVSVPAHCRRTCAAMLEALRWFASTQVRNVGTLAGNIATASPISDMNPLLVALNATLVVENATTHATRLISMQALFQSYRKTELAAEEVIVRVFVPFCAPYEFVHAYKQSRRREDDIALVGAAFRVRLQQPGPSDAPEHGWRVQSCDFAYAGMAPITRQAPVSSAVMTGRLWNDATVEAVCDSLRDELALPATVPGGRTL